MTAQPAVMGINLTAEDIASSSDFYRGLYPDTIILDGDFAGPGNVVRGRRVTNVPTLLGWDPEGLAEMVSRAPELVVNNGVVRPNNSTFSTRRPRSTPLTIFPH